MKKICLKIGIALLTLTFGLVTVWLLKFCQVDLSENQKNERINSVERINESENNLIRVNLKDKLSFDEKDYIEVSIDNYKRFMPYGRGCGNGYSQSYFTDDGYFLNEGVSSINRRKFNKLLKEAEIIIEKSENAKNRYDEKGLRVILQGRNNEKGKKFFEILWYRKGRLHYVSAPTLELALEFEKSNAYAF